MHFWLSIALLPAFVGSALAAVKAPVSVRFSKAAVAETPDFQRHVVPLLGRLGCNGRECHGSFQGKGGFRLSLFGFDFSMDHRALTQQKNKGGLRRVDLASPEKSLMLLKPTKAVKHKGGERFPKGEWEHHLLRRWIEAGAKRGAAQKLARLEVRPAELIFKKSGEARELKVIAHWADGAAEDVTPLCRFRANDDSVADISEAGEVTARQAGDTHVVAFYDNGVTAVPVLLPVANGEGKYPKVAAPTEIDRRINAKLRKLGVVPSGICTDAEFLRRVSLDLTATLPLPKEVRAFLADKRTDTRARKIEEFLKRPTYAAWWANKLGDYTGNSPYRQSEQGQDLAVQWYHWLRVRLAANVPYDELVEGIVLARGREPGEKYDVYAARTSAFFREKNPADFTARKTMPHFWARSNVKKPEEKALSFAHSFLGLRLQCAQCHKHPYDRWTQQDFQAFTKFFAPIQYGVTAEAMPAYRKLAKATGARLRGNQGATINRDLLAKAQDGRAVPWRELFVRKTNARLRLLTGETTEVKGDPREALMRWLRGPDQDFFARAMVNRVWGTYFHTGIIHPTDDQNAANPPSNEPLLDYLAAGFVKNKYDLQWVHRQILNSHAYQRAWRPNGTNAKDRRNFSHAIPRRLPAEVVYDAITQATAATGRQAAVRADLSRRAIGHLSTLMAGTYAMRVFGKPDRTTNCDCERSDDPSLLQSILMHNDPLVQDKLNEGGWLNEIAR